MGLLGGSRIWVAGSRGMAGAAITRALAARGIKTIDDPSREKLDLRCQEDVENWIRAKRPDVIYLAAARVGGIVDNAEHPADFITDNLQIETNVITAAAQARVGKLVFLGSSCIYPRMAPQPMREEDLMTGPLEDTNRAYAIAKLAGLELVRAYRQQYGCDFISVLPCNLYGPGDTYNAHRSHVIPALMLKIRAAMESDQSHTSHIKVWGTGNARREFMHVDDMADAVVHLAGTYSGASPVNIGTGEEISIRDLTHMLCGIAGYKGAIAFDTSKPDGAPRKILDCTRLHATGWQYKITLNQGLDAVWQDYLTTAHQTHHPRKRTA